MKAGTVVHKAGNRYGVTSAAVTKTSAGQKQPVVLSGGKEALLINIIFSKITKLFALHILKTIEGRQPHMAGLIPTLLAGRNNPQCYKQINSPVQVNCQTLG